MIFQVWMSRLIESASSGIFTSSSSSSSSTSSHGLDVICLPVSLPGGLAFNVLITTVGRV